MRHSILCALVFTATAARLQGQATLSDREARREAIRAGREPSFRFAKLLHERNFTAAAEMLDDSLRQKVGPDGLKQWLDKAEKACGPLADVDGFHEFELAGELLYASATSWKNVPKLTLWISLDDSRKVTGLWLDSTVHGAPAGIPATGVTLGRLESLAREAHHSLKVNVRLPGGDAPRKTSILVWKLTAATEQKEPNAGYWTDSEGRTWRAVSGASTGSELTADHLKPGTYRASAREGHESNGRVGLSDPVEILADQVTVETTITLQSGGTATLKPVDRATGQMTPRPQIVLTPLDGSRPPMDHRPIDSKDVPIRFEGLPPGKYRISASLSGWQPDSLQYAMADADQTVTIKSDVETTVDVPLTARLLTDDEIKQRWPWTAFGRVVDESGQPVAGAKVHVSTGWGTLLGGGQTTTNSQGEYRLRFAEGFATTSTNPVQAAHFHAASEGYLIKSSTRPLQTVMARQLPDEKDRFGHTPEEIPLMNKPFRLDIIMTRPAVSAAR